MISVYKHHHVQMVYEMHREVILARNTPESIFSYLKMLSHNLYQHYSARNEASIIEFSNYHPDFLGPKSVDLFDKALTLQDAWKCILHEYGFGDLKDHSILNMPIHNEFEQAIDVLLRGDMVALKRLIDQQPNLTMQRSSFGHNATFLHYTASNAVEMWRQVVPLNICDIVELLLEYGADKDAKIKAYGGRFTPFEMASTSAHPKAAGVSSSLLSLLS